MKISAILSVAILFTCTSCLRKMAQSPAADRKDDLHFLEKHFTADEMNKLKATKTVFFYRKGDQSGLDSLKKSITDNWTITPILFADISEFDT